MPRRVNQVERKILAVQTIVHLNGVTLDGDTALALQVHVVEHLRLHVLARHGARVLEQTVGQRALAVVNVSHDAEVPYVFHLYFLRRFFSDCKITNNRV